MLMPSSSVMLRAPATGRMPAGQGLSRARGLAAAAGVAGAITLLAAHQHHATALNGAKPRHAPRSKPRVSQLAVDALSGAVGEVASLVVLYPLDSLKVLCQARGASTGAVLAELRALGCSGRALRQLYAGCGSAALCSAAIGAMYLLTFYSAKRLGTAMLGSAEDRQQQQQQQLSSSSGGRQQPGSSGKGSQQPGGSATAHPPVAPNSEATHPLVASLAGVVASLAGSVFEAPMEMFKLRTQAGALEGPMLSTMLRAASTGGLGSLYATYAAFMLKSVPYDVAELATYSQMCDWREAAAAAAAGGGSSEQAAPGWQAQLGGALAAMPSSASDMLIGAAAGAASVLISMPCDVIKTRMDLQPASVAAAAGGGGLLRSTRAFVDTGRHLVAAGGGPQALFVGMGPRLLQTVPSCMVYWAAVEGCRRLMQHHCEVDVAEPSSSGSSPASSSSNLSSNSSNASGSQAARSASSSGSRGGECLRPAPLPSGLVPA